MPRPISTVQFIRAFALAGLTLALTAAAPARAGDTEAYPTKPVRIIVPYGAGGIADVTMRMTAKQLSEHFGQQFFIDNRANIWRGY